MDRLFVYGTLRNTARHMLGRCEHLGSARVRGRLYQVNPNFPGMILPQRDSDWVSGDVFRLFDLTAALARLDSYEGADYLRVGFEVEFESGESSEAWVYRWINPVREDDYLPSGDYLNRD